MNFSLNTSDLLKELQLLQGIVERKTTIPILSNLLIKTASGEITLEATDLEVGLRCKAPAEVQKEGRVTINARRIYDLIRSLPEVKLDFESQENNLRISGHNVDYKITVLPAEEFPGIPETDFEKSFKLPANRIKEGISKTIIAAAVDDTRYTLNGIFTRVGADRVSLVATDAHRLALYEIKLGVKNEEKEMSFIVPRKGAQEISNLIIDKEENGSLLFKNEENNLFFIYGGRFLVTRIIEGNYPQYEKVIPQENEGIARLDRQALLKTISRVDLVASEKSHAIVLDFSESVLVVSSSSPEFGEGTEKMDISYKGEKVRIAFNARYLIEFLNTATTGQVVIKLKDGKTAALLQEEGNEDYLYIISPIKL